jgi:hypothetical protein
VLTTRDPATTATLKADVLRELHQIDLDDDGVPSLPANGQRRNRDGLSAMQVGLHYSMLDHIRKARAGQHTWHQSEEKRFQFAVAVTLVHELVHIFWWWTRSKCNLCEGKEPWLSKSQVKSMRALSWETTGSFRRSDPVYPLQVRLQIT